MQRMVFQSFSYYTILGLPVIVYMGLITLILLLSTATLGYMVFTGKGNIKVRTHLRMAVLTVIFALVHAFFAFMARF